MAAKKKQQKYDSNKTYKVTLTKKDKTKVVREVKGNEVEGLEKKIAENKDRVLYYWVEEKYEPDKKHK